jgi:uridine kinase
MLKIIIEGYCAEGKTTVACEIAAILSSLGMHVTVHDLDFYHDNRTNKIRERSRGAMRGREVVIETIQLNRKGK